MDLGYVLDGDGVWEMGKVVIGSLDEKSHRSNKSGMSKLVAS